MKAHTESHRAGPSRSAALLRVLLMATAAAPMLGGWGRDERVDDIFFEEVTGDPSEEGQMRRTASDVVVKIGGVVRSITGGAADSLLGRTVFKVDGGMIYTTDGDVVIKVNQ